MASTSSGDSADRVEDECLDDELPDQPSAAGAERGAHENFGPRIVKRASSRLVTLPHAISSTSRTAAKSSFSASRTLPTVSSVSEERMNDVFLLRPGRLVRERRGNRAELRRGGIAGHTRIQLREDLHVA